MPYQFNPFTGKLDYYSAGGTGPQGLPGPQGIPGMMGLDGEDGIDGMPIPGPAGINGIPGTPGTPGVNGLNGPPGNDGDPGDDGIPIPGPQGLQGPPGVSGSPGQNAFPIALDGSDGDDGMPIPGPQGPQGIPGVTTTSTTFVYLEADLPDDPSVVPGTPGAAGTPGTTGSQGPVGPAVYLEAPDADEPLFHLGSQGPQGVTGSQGPMGVSTHFVMDITPEIDIGNEALSIAAGSYFDPDTGTVNVAGGLTSLTTIASTVTPTTGGRTLTGMVAATGSLWRVRAMGTFVAASSATARNALCAAFWGSTSLTVCTVGAVLASTAQTTQFELEFFLTGASTTAIWTTGWALNRVASTTALALSGITPASTTVTAGAQTIDLRFYSSVAVTGDSWSIQQVTIERIK